MELGLGICVVDDPRLPWRFARALWDSHIVPKNAVAKVTTNGTFHVPDSGKRRQVVEELLDTTTATLGFVLALSSLDAMVLTGNVPSSIAVGFTNLVTSSLAFSTMYIVQLMMGVLDFVANVVFTGYAVADSVHVAQKYGAEAIESNR